MAIIQNGLVPKIPNKAQIMSMNLLKYLYISGNLYGYQMTSSSAKLISQFDNTM